MPPLTDKDENHIQEMDRGHFSNPLFFLTHLDPTQKNKADSDPGGKGKRRILFEVFFMFRVFLRNVWKILNLLKLL